MGLQSTNIKDINFHNSVPQYAFVLIDDLSCRIWDIQACKLIHSISPQKITAFSPSLINGCIPLGTKDGQILSFCPHSFQCIQLCALPESAVNSDVSHRKTSPIIHPTSERPSWSKNAAFNPSISMEFSNEIVAFTTVDLISLHSDNDVPRKSEPGSSLSIILSRARLYVLDLSTHNVMASWSWMDLKLSNWNYIYNAEITSTSNAVNFWIRGKNDSVGFFTIPLENVSATNGHENLSNSSLYLSFIAKYDLLTNSVLNTCNKQQLFQNNDSNRNKSQFSTLNKTSLDKPVTFGHKIKSSGYAKQEPMRKMFHPSIYGRPKQRNTIKLGNEGKLAKLTKSYPNTDELPNVLQISGYVDSSTTPIYKVAYSPNGNSLASCLGNGICLITQRDQNTLEEKRKKLFSSAEALRGHLGPILWASWSTDSCLLLTCSSDRTARIWRIDVKGFNKNVTTKIGSVTQLIFDSIHKGATNDYGEKVNLKKKTTYRHVPFEDHISIGNFYYMDSFVYLVSKNIIRLYTYTLSNNENILKKSFANNSYKLVGEFPISTCNQLTSVASVNLFYSYLLVCAGSDRRLSILDLNYGKVIQEIQSAHNKCITGIALNQGSLYSSFNDSIQNTITLGTGYTVYATVAPKDCIQIWDLRESRYPVLKLAKFSSEIYSSGSSRNALIPPVTAVFSPCGTKLLVGGTIDVNQSSPVIYDVRKACSHPLAILNHEIRTNNSPATVVDWHPSKPEVSTGSHDGILSIYGIHRTQTKYTT
uniref:WD_REPEATS_REGION domain-containing protein n=1 Tax=Schistosoma mansoni TaxID=6183 RepID=A0A5K4FD22_SCHMA